MKTPFRIAAALALLPPVFAAGACAGPNAAGAGPEFVAPSPSSSPSSPSPAKPPKPTKPPKLVTDFRLKGPYGDVIDTGLVDKKGKPWVVYGVTGEDVGAAYGFAIGTRDSATTISADFTVNETNGKPSAPGFHTVFGVLELDGGIDEPAFGYYTGPAAKITVMDGDTLLTAGTATWSHDPGVTVFWFDPAQVHNQEHWSRLSAYGADGAKLPDGHIEVVGPI